MLDNDLIEAYCRAHASRPHPALDAFERNTHLQTLSPQMLSGPVQGALLYLIAQTARPQCALEIGAFTGYASVCIAQGMPDGGILHAIEVNDELRPLIERHIRLASLEHKIRLHIGDAAQIIPDIGDAFDLIFMDAGKMDYLRHYEIVKPRLNPGGWLVADNVLWDGKTVGDDKDATARVLREFNRRVHEDPDMENVILPIRDGLLLARKKTSRP